MKHYILCGTMITRIVAISTMMSTATFAQHSTPLAEPASPSANSAADPAATSIPAAESASGSKEVPGTTQTPPKPPPSNASSPPKLQLAAQAPAPTPAEARTDRLHDGFYMRVSLGFATQWNTLDDTTPRPNFTAKGSTMVADLLVGAAPRQCVWLWSCHLARL